MALLEKLGIVQESGDEFESEYRDEIRRDSDGVFGYESEEEFNPHADPVPGEAAPRPSSRGKQKISQVRDAGPRITKRMRDDAQSEIESMTTVIALAWGWQAPPCGDALEAAAPHFAEKLTKVLARNPRWLQRVRDGGMLADIIQVFGTLAPVARVAVAHYTQPKEAAADGGVVFDPNQFQPYDGTGFSRSA